MATVVVEVNWPEPLSLEELLDEDNETMRCLGERGGRWIRSHISLDRRRTVCVFEAPDAESVREAYRRGGVEHFTIWSADVFEPANASGT